MPAPIATDDSYATPMNVTLTVAAPGVLTNDTGDAPLTAAVVPDSATNGTVTLFPDGSFTFVPTTNFVGLATFSYIATDTNDLESLPVQVEIAVGDVLVWAHLTSGADGQRSVEGDGRGKTTWSVMADRKNRTGTEVCASRKLPQVGDALYRYKLEAGAYSITRSYERDGDTPANANVVCVLVEAKQEQQNPYLWTVTVSYEGKDDPTAELPEVTTGDTEYQDYKTHDIYGRPYANSAADPFEGGIPVDDAWDSLTITRNLPYGAWNTDAKTAYRNTLNLNPFRLGNQVDDNGDPIDLPPGTVRLKRITEQRLVRSKNAVVASAKFYWRVTAELVIDRRTFRQYSDTGAPINVPAKHRHVVADAGFNTLVNGARTPILLPGASRPTEPQLLNGSGALLANPVNTWPPPTAPGDGLDVCAATNKVYLCPAAGTLTVAAPGVLADCYSTTGDTADLTAHLVTNVTAAMGTLTLNSNGSFTFVKNASPAFVGYAWFTYRARAGGVAGTDSPPATVVIFVGAQPVMLAFDRYPYADWSDLSAILENW